MFSKLLLAHLAFAALPVQAASTYETPPKEILDVMRAPFPPLPVVSPTLDKILMVGTELHPSIQRVAKPFLRLAGVRIEPQNRSQHDTKGGYGIPPCVRNFDLVNVTNGESKSISLSKLSCPGRPDWSSDGKHFAFQNRAEDSVELWIGDAQTGRIAKVPGVQLNPMLGSEMQWMPDQRSLLVKLVPSNQGSPPLEVNAESGPSAQETTGAHGASSSYEKRDTLNSPHDEDLFDYYGTSQLALLDINHGTKKLLGTPALYENVRPSPDGAHFLVTSIEKPYSYLTTFQRFPKRVEVWDLSPLRKISRHLVASLPLADHVPIRGEPTGPRYFSWRPTAPATLLWAEALDGGDWNVKVPHRDKIMKAQAPFTAPPQEFTRTEQRYDGVDWVENSSTVLIDEADQNTHWQKTYFFDADAVKPEKHLLWSHSSDEHYALPGQPIYATLPSGFKVIRQRKNFIYLTAVGATENGDRPFLDRLDLTSLKMERLFRSDKEVYERFLSFLNQGDESFLTWHQSPSEVPNVYKRILGSPQKAEKGEAEYASNAIPFTHTPDPTPQVREIKKRLVKYKRADGVDLSFTLYTPPGYQEGTPLPTILNAYPLDYAESAMAGQVTGSQNYFSILQSYQLLLLAGYAVLDSASFPVVGDPTKAYDTYMEQLVADAQAAVNEAVKLGVTDPKRIGVTGHSHGAQMTVNLLAHSDLFRAGVATSGVYDNEITPFGFQNERRTLWQAPAVYHNVSPLFFADKLKTPLLLIHGADDANPGTTPLQSSLLYEAIRGNGGTARLVLLPHEPHWYTARESNEQEVFEMLRWFDKYVKNAPAN